MRSSSIKDMYRTCQAAASALPSPNRQYQWKCPPCRRSLSTVLPLILPTITLTRPLLTPCSGAAPSAVSCTVLIRSQVTAIPKGNLVSGKSLPATATNQGELSAARNRSLSAPVSSPFCPYSSLCFLSRKNESVSKLPAFPKLNGCFTSWDGPRIAMTPLFPPNHGRNCSLSVPQTPTKGGPFRKRNEATSLSQHNLNGSISSKMITMGNSAISIIRSQPYTVLAIVSASSMSDPFPEPCCQACVSAIWSCRKAFFPAFKK